MANGDTQYNFNPNLFGSHSTAPPPATLPGTSITAPATDPGTPRVGTSATINVPARPGSEEELAGESFPTMIGRTLERTGKGIAWGFGGPDLIQAGRGYWGMAGLPRVLPKNIGDALDRQQAQILSTTPGMMGDIAGNILQLGVGGFVSRMLGLGERAAAMTPEAVRAAWAAMPRMAKAAVLAQLDAAAQPLGPGDYSWRDRAIQQGAAGVLNVLGEVAAGRVAGRDLAHQRNVDAVNQRNAALAKSQADWDALNKSRGHQVAAADARFRRQTLQAQRQGEAMTAAREQEIAQHQAAQQAAQQAHDLQITDWDRRAQAQQHAQAAADIGFRRQTRQAQNAAQRMTTERNQAILQHAADQRAAQQAHDAAMTGWQTEMNARTPDAVNERFGQDQMRRIGAELSGQGITVPTEVTGRSLGVLNNDIGDKLNEVNARFRLPVTRENNAQVAAFADDLRSRDFNFSNDQMEKWQQQYNDLVMTPRSRGVLQGPDFATYISNIQRRARDLVLQARRMPAGEGKEVLLAQAAAYRKAANASEEQAVSGNLDKDRADRRSLRNAYRQTQILQEAGDPRKGGTVSIGNYIGTMVRRKGGKPGYNQALVGGDADVNAAENARAQAGLPPPPEPVAPEILKAKGPQPLKPSELPQGPARREEVAGVGPRPKPPSILSEEGPQPLRPSELPKAPAAPDKVPPIGKRPPGSPEPIPERPFVSMAPRGKFTRGGLLAGVGGPGLLGSSFLYRLGAQHGGPALGVALSTAGSLLGAGAAKAAYEALNRINRDRVLTALARGTSPRMSAAEARLFSLLPYYLSQPDQTDTQQQAAQPDSQFQPNPQLP